jgi:hypothetical protein
LAFQPCRVPRVFRFLFSRTLKLRAMVSLCRSIQMKSTRRSGLSACERLHGEKGADRTPGHFFSDGGVLFAERLEPSEVDTAMREPVCRRRAGWPRGVHESQQHRWPDQRAGASGSLPGRKACLVAMRMIRAIRPIIVCNGGETSHMALAATRQRQNQRARKP